MHREHSLIPAVSYRVVIDVPCSSCTFISCGFVQYPPHCCGGMKYSWSQGVSLTKYVVAVKKCVFPWVLMFPFRPRCVSSVIIDCGQGIRDGFQAPIAEQVSVCEIRGKYVIFIDMGHRANLKSGFHLGRLTLKSGFQLTVRISHHSAYLCVGKMIS